MRRRMPQARATAHAARERGRGRGSIFWPSALEARIRGYAPAATMQRSRRRPAPSAHRHRSDSLRQAGSFLKGLARTHTRAHAVSIAAPISTNPRPLPVQAPTCMRLSAGAGGARTAGLAKESPDAFSCEAPCKLCLAGRWARSSSRRWPARRRSRTSSTSRRPGWGCPSCSRTAARAGAVPERHRTGTRCRRTTPATTCTARGRRWPRFPRPGTTPPMQRPPRVLGDGRVVFEGGEYNNGNFRAHAQGRDLRPGQGQVDAGRSAPGMAEHRRLALDRAGRWPLRHRPQARHAARRARPP